MFGPNSAIGFGSLTKILEAEADYIVKVIRKLQKEDWVYESREGDGEGGNALRWLGNGWSTTQTSGDASWYINPDEIEVPYGKKPEENPRFKARPWSY